jgi:hypothetical protein
MSLTPADIEAIADAVASRLQHRSYPQPAAPVPPISPAELARKVVTHGKQAIRDFNEAQR